MGVQINMKPVIQKTYEEQTWAFVVMEIEGQVVFQTDSESRAIDYCYKHNKPASVLNRDRDRVYQNF